MNREDTIRMAREAGFVLSDKAGEESIERFSNFAALVTAAERNSWPAEMEAMERQVNILTDALAQAKAEERKIIMDSLQKQADLAVDDLDRRWALEMKAAIRARGETK